MAYEDAVTEFTTFPVKVGMETVAYEWLSVLKLRQRECIVTLDRERMHYECIFKIIRNGRLYLSWLCVRSPDGKSSRDSPHPIDHLHAAYWDKCIDHDEAPEKMVHVMSFLPDVVSQAIQARMSG